MELRRENARRRISAQPRGGCGWGKGRAASRMATHIRGAAVAAHDAELAAHPLRRQRPPRILPQHLHVPAPPRCARASIHTASLGRRSMPERSTLGRRSMLQLQLRSLAPKDACEHASCEHAAPRPPAVSTRPITLFRKRAADRERQIHASNTHGIAAAQRASTG